MLGGIVRCQRHPERVPEWFFRTLSLPFVGEVQAQFCSTLFSQIHAAKGGACLQQILEGLYAGWNLATWSKRRDNQARYQVVLLASELKNGTQCASPNGPFQVDTHRIDSTHHIAPLVQEVNRPRRIENEVDLVGLLLRLHENRGEDFGPVTRLDRGDKDQRTQGLEIVADQGRALREEDLKRQLDQLAEKRAKLERTLRTPSAGD